MGSRFIRRKPWIIWSTSVHSRSLKAGCIPYMKPVMMQSTDWVYRGYSARRMKWKLQWRPWDQCSIGGPPPPPRHSCSIVKCRCIASCWVAAAWSISCHTPTDIGDHTSPLGSSAQLQHMTKTWAGSMRFKKGIFQARKMTVVMESNGIPSIGHGIFLTKG